MPVTLQPAPDRTVSTVRLGPVLDLMAANPLKAEIGALRGRPITLDGSGVERIGGLCLQVLLSARASWAADGVAFSLDDPSPSFAEGLATMGASVLLSYSQE